MGKTFIKGFGFVDNKDELVRKENEKKAFKVKSKDNDSTNSESAKVHRVNVKGTRKRKSTK